MADNNNDDVANVTGYQAAGDKAGYTVQYEVPENTDADTKDIVAVRQDYDAEGKPTGTHVKKKDSDSWSFLPANDSTKALREKLAAKSENANQTYKFSQETHAGKIGTGDDVITWTSKGISKSADDKSYQPNVVEMTKGKDTLRETIDADGKISKVEVATSVDNKGVKKFEEKEVGALTPEQKAIYDKTSDVVAAFSKDGQAQYDDPRHFDPASTAGIHAEDGKKKTSTAAVHGGGAHKHHRRHHGHGHRTHLHHHHTHDEHRLHQHKEGDVAHRGQLKSQDLGTLNGIKLTPAGDSAAEVQAGLAYIRAHSRPGM